MTFPKLIAITGRAGSGKDTLASLLAADRDARIYSFALPIKQCLNAMFGWTMELWNDREWKETVIPWLGQSPRYLAQTLGTEWGRELVHPELWVLLAANRYQEHRRLSDTPFIIPDCRFDNEAGIVHTLGGVVIRVVRDSAQAVNPHKSEGGISDHLVHATIDNNGSVQDLYDRADSLLSRWARGL